MTRLAGVALLSLAALSMPGCSNEHQSLPEFPNGIETPETIVYIE
jgi:hypothetical protein